jgi:hypothetical protein
MQVFPLEIIQLSESRIIASWDGLTKVSVNSSFYILKSVFKKVSFLPKSDSFLPKIITVGLINNFQERTLVYGLVFVEV